MPPTPYSGRQPPQERGGAEKVAGIVAYSVCSSTLLVINKIAVRELPVPTIVSGIQLAFSVLAVLLMHGFGVISVPPLSTKKIKPFLIYTLCFAVGIFANIKALKLTTVGAVIAARSCLPLCVCLIEWFFMNRHLPSIRSSFALVGVLCCAGVYVGTDSTLGAEGMAGWYWLGTWWGSLAFQMTYGKYISDSVPMTQWERVLYTNVLGIPPTIVLFFLTGEFTQLDKVSLSVPAVTWLLISCAVGLGISYTGWKLRELITATTYTLVGVLNKMATIAITALVFPGDTSALGVTMLVMCILFGILYQDAPLRRDDRLPMHMSRDPSRDRLMSAKLGGVEAVKGRE